VRSIPAALVLLSAVALAACGDSSTAVEARIVSDTVTLAVPSAEASEPSAIDLVRDQPPFTFRRFPERLGDAQQWDLALRRADAGLALRPYSIPGAALRGTGIAVASTDYDRLDRAPRGTAAYRFSTTPIALGTTYVVRSRQYAPGPGAVCTKYGKLKVVALDAAAGTARIAVSVNENCEDERLTD
jgi:DNA-binding transcriptional LysR family regulator